MDYTTILVKDSADAPLAGATVVYNSNTLTTGSDGLAVFETEETTSITISKSGYVNVVVTTSETTLDLECRLLLVEEAATDDEGPLGGE